MREARIVVMLQLFGGFRLSTAAGEVPMASRKGQALLAYLALNVGQPQSREKLATLLWGDRQEEQARHSLRQAILSLRKALGDDAAAVLVADGDTLTVDRDRLKVDVWTFERHAADDSRAATETAATLYGGNLLDGFNVNAEDFDAWSAAERRRLHAVAADVLERRMVHLVADGDREAALDGAQAVLRLDPVCEAAHRVVMQLYSETGRRSAALRHYQTCRDILLRELDTEPEAETQRLYEAIRAGSLNADVAPATMPPVEATAMPTAPSETTYESPSPLPPAAEAAVEMGAPPVPEPDRLRRFWVWGGVAAVLLLLAVGGTLWFTYLRGPIIIGEPARVAEMVFPLPEKPSIAVLPFTNLSGDPADDPLVDGITAGITSAFSMISEMFVIDRNSALSYKDRPIKTQRVAEELGVRYVLVGSVQAADGTVRISAELIDALQGHLVWADVYDRELTDIFALQDELTLEIVKALQVQIIAGEQDRISLIHGTRDLQAWILAGQGLQHFRRLTPQDNARARALYQEAAALDPDYPGAWDGLAWVHFLDGWFGWGPSREASMRRAAELAQKTLALDPERPRTIALLGALTLMKGEHEVAVTLAEKAVALNPNGAEVTALLALILTYSGDYDRGISLINRAMRLSPTYPPWYRWTLGRAYRLAGRHAEAIRALSSSTEGELGSLVFHVELAMVYSRMDRMPVARAEAARALALDPTFSARAWTRSPPHKDPTVTSRDFAALRLAGLPE
jgi:TolB-like protein/DNA-binding SARP family transcriptional activator